MPSWFQQVTFFPALINARLRPTCEPTQSPSGRTWPTTQIVSLALMASTMRSTIFGWTFIGQGLGSGSGLIGLFNLIENLEHAIATLDRFVDDKLEMRSVLENNGAT